MKSDGNFPYGREQEILQNRPHRLKYWIVPWRGQKMNSNCHWRRKMNMEKKLKDRVMKKERGDIRESLILKDILIKIKRMYPWRERWRAQKKWATSTKPKMLVSIRFNFGPFWSLKSFYCKNFVVTVHFVPLLIYLFLCVFCEACNFDGNKSWCPCKRTEIH